MEADNKKRLHVMKLCRKYRPNPEPVGTCYMSPKELHKKLRMEQFDDGAFLDSWHIAEIVNYCYYQRDARLIAQILAEPMRTR